MANTNKRLSLDADVRVHLDRTEIDKQSKEFFKDFNNGLKENAASGNININNDQYNETISDLYSGGKVSKENVERTKSRIEEQRRERLLDFQSQKEKHEARLANFDPSSPGRKNILKKISEVEGEESAVNSQFDKLISALDKFSNSVNKSNETQVKRTLDFENILGSVGRTVFSGVGNAIGGRHLGNLVGEYGTNLSRQLGKRLNEAPDPTEFLKSKGSQLSEKIEEKTNSLKDRVKRFFTRKRKPKPEEPVEEENTSTDNSDNVNPDEYDFTASNPYLSQKTRNFVRNLNSRRKVVGNANGPNMVLRKPRLIDTSVQRSVKDLANPIPEIEAPVPQLARPAAAEALGATEGGAALTGRIGAGLLGAGVGTIIGGAALLLKQAYDRGIEQWKTDSKANATFDIDRNNFGRGGGEFGMGNKEYHNFILQSARSRGSATNIEDIAAKQQRFMRGYGLGEGDVRAFDQFTYQDKNGSNSTTVIADILRRSEAQGVLGVSKGDFSRLPEKIQQVAGLLAQQKANREQVDSNEAVQLQAAGNKIGGRFGDDRQAETFGYLNNAITGASGGWKSLLFEGLRRKNPGDTYTQLQGRIENGANRENLETILPMVNKLSPEMRERILYSLFKSGGDAHSAQDAVRLSKGGNIDEILNQLNKTTSAADLEAQYGKARERTDLNTAYFDKMQKNVVNSIDNMAEKVARSINDGANATFNPSKRTTNSNYGAENTVTTGKAK